MAIYKDKKSLFDNIKKEKAKTILLTMALMCMIIKRKVNKRKSGGYTAKYYTFMFLNTSSKYFS